MLDISGSMNEKSKSLLTAVLGIIYQQQWGRKYMFPPLEISSLVFGGIMGLGTLVAEQTADTRLDKAKKALNYSNRKFD